jgi:demethylmenaquinone methyltransferase/2-methoxy-6-polyprenyl-1,4-benzoquinol methylase
MTRVIDDEMRAYYDGAAAEYDDVWLGAGHLAQLDRPGWDEAVAELLDAIRALAPARTLDVACGTGFLTRHLPGDITALDQSEQMLAIARRRMPDAHVVQGEAVPLPFAGGEFDRVVTSHFYGHLQPDERERFVAEARRVAPELVVVDSAGRGAQWEDRELGGRSRYRVYKRWFTGPELAAELGGGDVLVDGRWFVAVRA